MPSLTIRELIDNLTQFLIEKNKKEKGSAFSFNCKEFIEYLETKYKDNKKIISQYICPFLHQVLEASELVTIIKRSRAYIYIVERKKLTKLLEYLLEIEQE